MTKEPRLPKWLIKQNARCDAMRAQAGAKFGDGLALLKKMREEGNEAQQMLAKTYVGMSANAADAMISLHASNPLLRLLMETSLDPTDVPLSRVQPPDRSYSIH